MAWSYTAYILWKYCSEVKKDFDTINFSEFADFIFKTLGRKCKLILHDGEKDLYLDLKYLEEIGAIKIEKDEASNDEILKINRNELKTIADAVKTFTDRTTRRIGLASEYLKRINDAIKLETRVGV